MKKGFFFTLDVVLALFFLVLILSTHAELYSKQSASSDLATKRIGQEILNTMEKTGFIDNVALGNQSSTDVLNYLMAVMPSTMAGSFSLTSYRYGAGFTVDRSVNASTGSPQVFSVTRRVALVPAVNNDRYVVVTLGVGYR
ncbi:MAG: hypothetical protein Q8R15_01075 [Candidatus Micrarchaeota archaeon]|nr:hypothetical protein [Candidatus Micrarchaeota archaeon]